ncbi:MAG: hypothetical protein ACO3IN_10150 [Steroidobacteraceae bacterium]
MAETNPQADPTISDLKAQIAELDGKIDSLRLGIAKMILGMSGQPVVIDIAKDLGVTVPMERPLVIPASGRQ